MSTLLELREVYNGALRLVRGAFTGRCPLCEGSSAALSLCAGCLAELPRRPSATLHEVPRGLTQVHAICTYRYPLAGLIVRAKFRRDLPALLALGRYLADCASAHLHAGDLVVPVPLAVWRYVGRGYNQALELARPLAAQSAARFAPDTLRRVHGGRPQSARPAGGRARALGQPFVATRMLRGERVVLVDDVITSGATLRAAAAALHAAGASEVSAIVLATAWQE